MPKHGRKARSEGYGGVHQSECDSCGRRVKDLEPVHTEDGLIWVCKFCRGEL